jgi:hypothetical protein
MNNRPDRPRSLETFHRLTMTGLPLALSLVLAACGGGSDNTPAAEQRTASAMKRMGGASASEPEVALTPVAATSSGSERGDLSAAAAIDHNPATRWGSLFSDDQYLTLDFGASKPINRVHIEWENAHALQYLLQVSDDNANWTTIKTVDNSTGGIEDWTGLGAQGRYLRMKGVKRSTNYGYSIFEIQAYSGGATTDPPPTTTPDPVPVDTTKPGVAIKPVTATSSPGECR